MPTGMPASGGSGSPLAASASMRAAWAESALFGQAQINIEARILLLDAVVAGGSEIGGLGAARGDLGAQSGDGLRLFNK